jgi:histidinol-phosphate aminotransferase
MKKAFVPFPQNSNEHNLEGFLPLDRSDSLFYFSSPHLPNGTFFDLQRLDWFLRKIKHATVVIDEAYIEFVGADFREHSAANLLGRYKHLIVTRTFSKGYGIASQRVAVAMADPELKNKVFPSFKRYRVMNGMGVRCAIAAMEDEAHMAASRDYVHKEQAKYQQRIKDYGKAFCFPSLTNFLAVFIPYSAKNRRFRDEEENSKLYDKVKLVTWNYDNLDAFCTYIGMRPGQEMEREFSRMIGKIETSGLV